jgi:hypothetical protein
LTRGDVEVNTRDALLGSVGIKLRPDDARRTHHYEIEKAKRDISGRKSRIRDLGRMESEGRMTPRQVDRRSQRLEDLIRRGPEQRIDRLNDAADLLSAQGRFRGPEPKR